MLLQLLRNELEEKPSDERPSTLKEIINPRNEPIVSQTLFLREKWNDQVSKTKQRSWQRAKERDETIKVNDFRVWSVVWLMIFFGKNEFFAFGWDRLDFTVSNQDDFYMFRVNDTQWYEI